MRRSDSEIHEELDEIEAILRLHPEGMTRRDVGDRFEERRGERLPSHTIRRRLNKLLEDRRAHREGPENAPVYRVGPPAHRPHDPSQPEPESLPLSHEAEHLRAQIRRPITERPPVGYHREFLEDYTPGETWYLTERQRRELHERGRTPDPSRPAGTFAREIYENLLIDLSWASSRLEGNTYSRLDTASLLKFGHRAEGKDAVEAQMVLNHKRAIDFLVDRAEEVAFDSPTLLTLHASLAENLVGDPGDEGRLRARMVQISGTTFTPMAIPQVIQECFDLMLKRLRAIPDPFEQAFFVMVHLPYLQPFIDVNKRTSRLAANIPLLRENLCPLSFVDVPRELYLEATLAVYETRETELLRDVFLWAYDRSCAQYRVVRDALVQPDPIRLRYRDELADAVRHVVRGPHPPTPTVIQAFAGAAIPQADRDVFVERVQQILLGLNEGIAGRYGITSEELVGWLALVRES